MNGDDDDYDESAEISRAMRKLARTPRPSLDVQIAILKEKVWEIGKDMIGIKKALTHVGEREKQEILWNDYQRRLGRDLYIRYWLGLLTIAISAVGAFAVLHH